MMRQTRFPQNWDCIHCSPARRGSLCSSTTFYSLLYNRSHINEQFSTCVQRQTIFSENFTALDGVYLSVMKRGEGVLLWTHQSHGLDLTQVRLTQPASGLDLTQVRLTQPDSGWND